MSPERWQKVARIFGLAMDESLAERSALLERECGSDAALRREIEELLTADTRSDVLSAVVEKAARGLASSARAAPHEEGDALAEAGVSVGGLIDGRYRVVRVLGEGGMGVVVEAVHVNLSESVAIKLLRPLALSADRLRQRFMREARAAAKMRSPHICKVRDVGVLDSGAPFMVMDLLQGADLQAVLRARKTLPYVEAVMVALEACEALATAHARGVVHRDIKPGNLFLERASHGAVVLKLLDFGISKLLDNDGEQDGVLTRSAELVGSPAYMSPEQLRSSRDVDARADIWSLGVVLYEMLQGARPFLATSLADVTGKILFQEPPKLVGPWPDALADVVHRCMAKEREARHEDVGALAVALAPFCGVQGHQVARRVVGTLGAELLTTADIVPADPIAAAFDPVGAGAQLASAQLARAELASADTAAVSTELLDDSSNLVEAGTFSATAASVNQNKTLSWRPVALVATLAAVGVSVWWLSSSNTANTSAAASAATAVAAPAASPIVTAPALASAASPESTTSASAPAALQASASAAASAALPPPRRAQPLAPRPPQPRVQPPSVPPPPKVDPYGSRR